MVIISNPPTDGQSSQTQQHRDGLEASKQEGINDVDEPPLPDPGLPGAQHHDDEKGREVKDDIEIVKNENNLDGDGGDVAATWDGDADLAHLFEKDEIAKLLGVDVL